MVNDKPADLGEYTTWLREERGFVITYDIYGDYYSLVTSQMRQQLVNCPFWKQLCSSLLEYNDGYFMAKGDRLLLHTEEPEVLIKPFDSFYDKTFRKNVLENANWPEAPENEWILPDRWFAIINDILRTSIVVRYLDGVPFTTDRLELLCVENSKHPDCKFEAREEAYYAAHLYFRQEFEIPKFEWNTEKVNAWVEIQIRTQLQDVIRSLLHKLYEKRRGKLPTGEQIWQWQYESPEFATNYLGHILHYVDGMIIGIREKE